MIEKTEWEKKVQQAFENKQPAPAIVFTLRDPDGTVSGEVVFERGARYLIGVEESEAGAISSWMALRTEPL